MNNDKLREVAGELVARLEAIHKDENYLAVWQCYWNHSGVYAGPFYGDELAALKQVIEEPTPEPVDDKALAAALAWTDCELTTDEFSKKHVADLHACRKNESEYTGDAACRILAQALRAAQLEVADLRKALEQIYSVGSHWSCILIAREALARKARAAGEVKGRREQD